MRNAVQTGRQHDGVEPVMGDGLTSVQAVDAVGAAKGPLLTLQAWATQLADTAQTAGAAVGAASLAGHSSPSAAHVLPGPLPSTVATAQAVQGRLLLGELANETMSQRVLPSPFGTETLRPALQVASAAEGASAARRNDVVTSPVLLNPLQPPPDARVQARQVPAEPARQRRPAQIVGPADEHDGQDQPPVEPDALPEEEGPCAASSGWASRRDLLQRGGQKAVLRELAQRRAVLLVQPHARASRGPVTARAWLLRQGRATPFQARWWPGAAAVEDDAWRSWRVFRDGAPMLGNGLRSRGGASACRVRLGVATLAVDDAQVACLQLADRLRLAHALGPQWTLLLVVAPAGEDD